jgi:hypothetical protein
MEEAGRICMRGRREGTAGRREGGRAIGRESCASSRVREKDGIWGKLRKGESDIYMTGIRDVNFVKAVVSHRNLMDFLGFFEHVLD